jgi:hypothetical protein
LPSRRSYCCIAVLCRCRCKPTLLFSALTIIFVFYYYYYYYIRNCISFNLFLSLFEAEESDYYILGLSL